MTQTRLVDTFYPARTDLINRRVEMGMIEEAISSKDSRALFFVGKGGIGKTRLLEEILSKKNFLETHGTRCSDLIDLYHPKFHNPDHVQFYIAEQIDPQNRFFQEYRILHQAFLSAEENGVERKKLTELAEKRDSQFLSDYRALTEYGKARILLVFDTTEQIQHESDAVQALYGVQTQNLAIHLWLTELAPQLPNTVIILAGRPKPDIEAHIREGFEANDWVFQSKNLETFERDDAIAYINALLCERPLPTPLDDSQKEWIFQYTEGKPIRLALVLQFIYYEGFDALRAKIDRGVELDKILIEHLIHLPAEYGEAMHYMLLARNGMDAGLLAHLTGWTDEKIQRYFQEMQSNVLFKPLNADLFLHDWLYELHDRYYRDDPQTAHGYETIAAYYRAKLEQQALYKEQLDLRIRTLFYELQQHPEQGYQLFSRWDEEAIWLHFKGADLRLRDEMLRFSARYLRRDSEFYDDRMAEQISVEEIDAENAIRCLEREIADEKYGRASRIAETILTDPQAGFGSHADSDPLYRARVLYAWAEAALYDGHLDLAKQSLQETINLLEPFEPKTDAQLFWKTRTLGRTYNRLGYYHRVRGYYAKSVPLYRKAVTEFHKAGLSYMLAQTLTNLAYILAQIGDTETAFEHVQAARKIWEGFDMNYRLAMTLSAMSRILVEANKPIAALKEIDRAWTIVRQMDEPVAMIMLMISEGRALRKQGNLWKDELAMYPKEEANEYLQKSENILLEAESLLTEQSTPLQRWEVSNELGSLYCDWAWLHRDSKNRILASTCYLNSIKCQDQALAIVQKNDMPFQVADSLDDLAQARGDRAFFLLSENRREEAFQELYKAEQTLSKAEATVPEEYWRLGRTSYLIQTQMNEHEEGAPFWLVLGKSHLWRGVWKFRQLEYEGHLSLETHPEDVEQATDLLLSSQVYFKHYSENSANVDRNTRYLSKFMQMANVSSTWMEKQIEKVEKKYQITLPFIRVRMQNKLWL